MFSRQSHATIINIFRLGNLCTIISVGLGTATVVLLLQPLVFLLLISSVSNTSIIDVQLNIHNS
ncbi:hypothetical protein HanRHA438_Chr17g0812661 [Helianthus annuus]|nr:hypothetical protein HanRHA438_Chr17g0812661 [Helianthus annuus]